MTLRDFRVDGTQFSLNQYDDRLQIISIRPYDETEYHWAYMLNSDGVWHICRECRKVVDFMSARPRIQPWPTPEQVAEKLLQLDREANLKPRIDRT